MDPIKQERIDDEIPEGLLPNTNVNIPAGFERDEWVKLTEGFMSEEDEVNYIVSLRGQGGTRKGRPTNFSVPFKGQLSSSDRAIAQRDRAALRNIEEQAIERAKASDRSAKYQLKSKLQKSEKYLLLPKDDKPKFLIGKQEELVQKRYNDKKSAEWLEDTLQQAHKKWEAVQHEVDVRQHQEALEKVAKAKGSSSTTPNPSRGATRLYGSGGIVENIMRNIYNDGLAKLKSNSFENKEAKEEWQRFVQDLTPDELAIVTNNKWTPREPTSIQDLLRTDNKDFIDSNRPYIMGDNSDECEEEVDDDSEIEEYYNQEENEYETEEQWQETQKAAAQSSEAGSEEETDFEGFSDSLEETDSEGSSDATHEEGDA